MIVGVDDEADSRSKDIDEYHEKRAYVQRPKYTWRQYVILTL